MTLQTEWRYYELKEHGTNQTVIHYFHYDSLSLSLQDS